MDDIERLIPIKEMMNLRRNYLSTMEKLLENEDLLGLQAEAQEHRKEIEKRKIKEAMQTDEEREEAFNQALEEWENSWAEGFYNPPLTDDEYYNSPEYELEILEMLQSQFEDEAKFDFKYILRSSFFVHICSLAENRLYQICDLVKDAKEISFAVRDLRGRSNIDKVKIYLTKTTGVDFGKLIDWETLRPYSELRNCVVHEGGNLKIRNRFSFR